MSCSLLALLIQQVEHPELGLDEVDAGLVVVEVDHLPLDPLLDILLLLQLEHVLVELLLQLLVGVVDTELLEGIRLESLEAVNVKDSDELVDLEVGLERPVDLVDDPVEDVAVDTLDQGVPERYHDDDEEDDERTSVPGLVRFLGVHGLGVGLPDTDDLPAAQPRPQLALLHLEDNRRRGGVMVSQSSKWLQPQPPPVPYLLTSRRRQTMARLVSSCFTVLVSLSLRPPPPTIDTLPRWSRAAWWW